jgi:hypothetical protein
MKIIVEPPSNMERMNVDSPVDSIPAEPILKSSHQRPKSAREEASRKFQFLVTQSS